MFELKVPDIRSEDCASKIRKAVRGVDSDARCDVDVDAKRVSVDSELPPSDFVEALEEVGYASSIFGPGR